VPAKNFGTWSVFPRDYSIVGDLVLKAKTTLITHRPLENRKLRKAHPMLNSPDSVLDAVIILLQSENRDLNSVTLEEAKELTFQLICRRRTTTLLQEKGISTSPRSLRVQKCSA
jgi:hypothetical protein